mgnify:FL=1
MNTEAKSMNLAQIKREIEEIDRGVFDVGVSSLMKKRENFKITKKLSLRKDAVNSSMNR